MEGCKIVNGYITLVINTDTEQEDIFVYKDTLLCPGIVVCLFHSWYSSVQLLYFGKQKGGLTQRQVEYW